MAAAEKYSVISAYNGVRRPKMSLLGHLEYQEFAINPVSDRMFMHKTKLLSENEWLLKIRCIGVCFSCRGFTAHWWICGSWDFVYTKPSFLYSFILAAYVGSFITSFPKMRLMVFGRTRLVAASAHSLKPLKYCFTWFIIINNFSFSLHVESTKKTGTN